MKLGLGTVQFGLDYGVSNKKGKPELKEVIRILRLAKEAGIHVIDTAAVYGESENILGQGLSNSHSFKIVTKTPGFKNPTIHESDLDHLEKSFNLSSKRLNQKYLYGLLIHNSEDVFKPGGYKIVDRMTQLARNGSVQKIGVSVYTGDQIDHVLEIFRPDIIQLPINFLDQRLIESGHLVKLKKLGIEIHARSIFLQGLLLMENKENPFYSIMKDKWDAYQLFLKKNGLSRLQAALNFVLRRPELDCLVVGVCSAKELGEVLKAYHRIADVSLDMSEFSCQDEHLLDPSRWK